MTKLLIPLTDVLRGIPSTLEMKYSSRITTTTTIMQIFLRLRELCWRQGQIYTRMVHRTHGEQKTRRKVAMRLCYHARNLQCDGLNTSFWAFKSNLDNHSSRLSEAGYQSRPANQSIFKHNKDAYHRLQIKLGSNCGRRNMAGFLKTEEGFAIQMTINMGVIKGWRWAKRKLDKYEVDVEW